MPFFQREARAHAWLTFAIIAAGGFSLVLGILVLTGWFAHIPLLVQLRPTLAPVQPNTAVLFILSGLGLLTLVTERLHLTGIAGALAVLICTLTLLEYLLHADFGIDQVLLTSTVTAAVTHPGRMAPNTAMGFVLVGVSLLLISQSVTRLLSSVQHLSDAFGARCFSAGLIFAALIVTLGAIACFGYLSTLETASGWGQLTRMSLPTAITLTVLGLGIVAYVWRENSRRSAQTLPWLSLLVSMSGGAVTLLLWQAMGVQDQLYIQQTIQNKLLNTRHLLITELEPRLFALVRMAKRWEHSGQPSKDAWEADAALNLQHYHGYATIEWVDPTFHITWIESLTDNKNLKNYDLSGEEQRRTLLETARDQRRPVVSNALDLIQGGRGFVVAIPIFRRDEFAGVIQGVFRFQEILDLILEQTVQKDFIVALFDGDKEVYHSAPGDQQLEERWGQEVTFQFHDVAWRLQIQPRQQMLARNYSVVSEVLLLVGFTVTGLLVAIIQLSQSARQRAQEIEENNQALRREIDIRKTAEKALRDNTQALSRSEAALRQQTTLMQSILECMSEDVVVADAQGQILLMNQAAQHTLGISPVDAPKAPPEDWPQLTQIYLPDQQTLFPAEQLPLVRAMRGEVTNNCEQFIRRPHSPEKLWRSVNGQPLRDTEGRVCGGIAVGRNITAHKQMEGILRESEERFRRAFDDAAVGMALVTLEGYFLRVNSRLCQLVGYDEHELLSTTFQTLTHPDDLEDDLAHVRQILDGEIATYRLEKRYLHKRGHIVWILLSVSLVRNDHGKPLYFVSQIQDISALKASEALLIQRSQELARSNAELQQFALVASHDLQEPLRKIRTFGDLLHTQCADTLDEQGHDYLARMQRSAERMQNLIKDLLALSRVTTRGHAFSPVDLAQVAREVVGDLEARVQETNGRVELESLPIIEADPTQMRQLLQNLIGNALKFHRKDESPHVTISSCMLNGQSQPPSELPAGAHWCQITVTDNGIGFDEQYLDRIFLPFQRLQGRQEYEGTGMGLAICRKIVERHGGRLSATSTPDHGATFIITVPSKHVEEISHL
ncbi:MAG: PAS domain S-box protein [Candidatus Binatia bacterium]